MNFQLIFISLHRNYYYFITSYVFPAPDSTSTPFQTEHLQHGWFIRLQVHECIAVATFGRVSMAAGDLTVRHPAQCISGPRVSVGRIVKRHLLRSLGGCAGLH